MSEMDISSPSEFSEVVNKTEHIVLIHVYNDNNLEKSQISNIFKHLKQDYEKLGFYHIKNEIASQVDLLKPYKDLAAVVFFLGGFPINSISTQSPGSIAAQTRELAHILSPKEKLEKLLKDNKAILFMKGTKQDPFCKFSRRVVEILNSLNVEYETFDILQDEIMRVYLKAYSNWPTYPQLYNKGELVGGHDIIVELNESGELASLFS